MRLIQLSLKNFRNLNLDFTVDPGINLISGSNGAGKSNLLDGIYFLAFTKSFKPYSEKNNIAWNNPLKFSFIKAQIRDEAQKDAKPMELKIIFNNVQGSEQKRLEINGLGKTRRNFVYRLPVVLFAPHNINWLAGSPDVRREEFDDFICSISPDYVDKLSAYKSVIRNRNKILQKINEGIGQIGELNYWNEKLVDLGAFIVTYRSEIIQKFQPSLRQDALKIFHSELANLSLVYQSKFNGGHSQSEVGKLLRNKIQENLTKEISAGQTLYGPQRDDYSLLADDKDLKVFGSRGQQRIATLIVKMAMFNYIKSYLGITPVILLDDIMSELDNLHRKNLEKYLLNLNAQLFLTATEEKMFGKEILKKAKLLKIGN